MNLTNNIKKKYFIASFRYDKTKPEDFDLSKNEIGANYIDKNGNLWIQDYLWDNGFGNEYGFIRFPEPEFEKLWVLLVESIIFENYRGAAELINRKYPFELKGKLEILFKNENRLSRKMTKRIKLLEIGVNRNEVLKISKDDVERNYQDWKKLKMDFERLSAKPFWLFYK